jgi:NTP pyrophosphatase (non-canonical NTP hydrolase)
MDKGRYSALIAQMAEINGLQNIKAKLVEELAELIRALARGEDEMILEEMADVRIMLDQFVHIMSDSKKDRLDEWMQEKGSNLSYLIDRETRHDDEAELIEEVSG